MLSLSFVLPLRRVLQGELHVARVAIVIVRTGGVVGRDDVALVEHIIDVDRQGHLRRGLPGQACIPDREAGHLEGAFGIDRMALQVGASTDAEFVPVCSIPKGISLKTSFISLIIFSLNIDYLH